MESLRSKDGFDFEEDDSKYPYKIDTFDIGNKRTTAFNYSPRYFRKKVGGSNGLYQVIGGNIPSDMATEYTFNFGNNTSSPPPPLVCNLNKGTAENFRSFKSINLTPSYISHYRVSEYPSEKPGTKRSEANYINPEMGNLNKPNFMYLPVFQNSCSTHPRASGYAHDDINGICLKYYEYDLPPEAEGKCCQDGVDCIRSVKLFSTTGSEIPAKDEYATFDCLTDNRNANNIFDGHDCGFKISCTAGYRRQGGVSNPCNSYNPSPPPKIGSCPSMGGTTELVSVFVSTIFHFAGNSDCGNKRSTITVSSIEECSYCAYTECKNGYSQPIEGPIKPPGWSPSSASYTKHCKTISSDKANYCGCLYNEVGGDVLISTMNSPTTRFPNWSRLFIDDNGTITSAPCGAGEQYMTCNDVS
jgi:hypothetical protein